MVVGLGQKMDVLWGFLKSHLTAKTIVFLSTCKQVWDCLWCMDLMLHAHGLC